MVKYCAKRAYSSCAIMCWSPISHPSNTRYSASVDNLQIQTSSHRRVRWLRFSRTSRSIGTIWCCFCPTRCKYGAVMRIMGAWPVTVSAGRAAAIAEERAECRFMLWARWLVAVVWVLWRVSLCLASRRRVPVPRVEALPLSLCESVGQHSRFDTARTLSRISLTVPSNGMMRSWSALCDIFFHWNIWFSYTIIVVVGCYP